VSLRGSAACAAAALAASIRFFHGGKVPIQTVLAEDFTLQMAETAKALDDGQWFQSLR
jgi:hypothetical protein